MPPDKISYPKVVKLLSGQGKYLTFMYDLKLQAGKLRNSPPLYCQYSFSPHVPNQHHISLCNNRPFTKKWENFNIATHRKLCNDIHSSILPIAQCANTIDNGKVKMKLFMVLKQKIILGHKG